MPRPRSEMRRVREVLRLRAELGENLSAVAAGAGHAKLIALLAVVGAGAIGGIVYATQAGGGTTPAATAPPVTIGAGSGTVGPPK